MKGHFSPCPILQHKKKFCETDLYCFVKKNMWKIKFSLFQFYILFIIFSDLKLCFVYMPVMDFGYAGHVTGLVCGVHFCNTLGKGTYSSHIPAPLSLVLKGSIHWAL